MILTLAWKEICEHRSIWLTMVVMTALMAVGFAQLAGITDTVQTVAISVLAMVATFGVVCGSMMFAGEREGGTLVFLDIFLGRRGLLWLMKLLIGVVLAITQALAVSLTLQLLDQEPPEWLAMLAGRMHWAEVALPAGAVRTPGWGLWYLALPLVTLEAFAWGLLGSSLTQRVLSGAALAVVIGLPVWLIGAFAPPPSSIVLRLVFMILVLSLSCGLFMSQARDTPMGAPPLRIDRRQEVLRRMMLEMYDEEPVVIVPIDDVSAPALVAAAPAAPPPPRRTRRPPQADSPRQVLRWLTYQQAGLPLALLGVAALLFGFLMPYAGQVLWPIATLLLGIACGTATFAWEQSDQSYQFLAAQHFPLNTVWNVKVLFWLTAAILGSLLMLLAGGLVVLLGMAVDRNAGANRPLSFDFGNLRRVMGSWNFFAVWLAHGFCVAGVFVYLCRKMVYALIISTLVAGGVMGLWWPSVLCRGMGGWQLWLGPVAALAAMRLSMRPWAGGRVKERKPLQLLFGLAGAAAIWAGINFAHRAWEIPDVGAPMDHQSFRASVPAGQANEAAQKIQEAIEGFKHPGGQAKDQWLTTLAQAARLPTGVLETPAADGQRPLLRHLPDCAAMTGQLRLLARKARKDGKLDVAGERLGLILALSRNLRNKAPQASYLAGIETEKQALEEFGLWFAERLPPAALLRQILDDLDRHAAATPPALDCLRTECHRAEGALRYPTTWEFYSDARAANHIREPWLAGGIALALDVPWEAERKTRLWRAVWAGHFRALQAPHWQLPPGDGGIDGPQTPARQLMHGWLPATDGAVATLSAERITRLLEASWLADERLFTSAVALRFAATRARWRMDASRLTVALCLYQARESKAAQKLDDLVPKDLPELPVDPYSGKAYRYRLSAGENLDVLAGDAVQGQIGRVGGAVQPGQAILWSTGPDGADDGGRKHGAAMPDVHARWRTDGFDLLTVVPSTK